MSSIVPGDLKFYKSASDPGIGGAITQTQIQNDVDKNIFEWAKAPESKAGSAKYRLIYVKNTKSSATAYDARAYVDTNTPSADDEIEIGLAAAGASATEPATADEDTAPPNVAFSKPADYDNGLALGDIAPNEYYGIWVKRTIDPNASGYKDNTFILAVQGETF